MRPNWMAVVNVMALATPVTAQVYVPIPVTGYTQGVIADAVGLSSATTTAAVDYGFEPANNNVFVEQGYSYSGVSANGIPANGTIITSATRTYQLGSITGNNSLQITPPKPTGTLTLVTPARDAALSILLTGGDAMTAGNVGLPGGVAINWSDGQSSTYTYTLYDWWDNNQFGTPPGVAIGGLNRVDRSTGLPTSLDMGVQPAPTFAIYYFDIDLNVDANYQAGALVDSLTFQLPGSTNDTYLTLNVMGLSGATSVPEPSTLTLLSAVAALALWRRRFQKRS